MAAVHLRFVAPDVPDLTTLRIYEAATISGPFAIIEEVTPIGEYPNYIDNYTTNLANNQADYFAVDFVDSKGASTDLSQAVRGDSELAIGEITRRVMERDSSLSETVVLQEAEAAIAYAYPGYADDPYDPALQPTYLEKRGLTNLTLAMCYLVSMAQITGTSWTAGIVSLKTDPQAIKFRQDSIQKLITQANRDLGLNFSMVAFLEDLDVAGGIVRGSLDQSRLLLVEFR